MKTRNSGDHVQPVVSADLDDNSIWTMPHMDRCLYQWLNPNLEQLHQQKHVPINRHSSSAGNLAVYDNCSKL